MGEVEVAVGKKGMSIDTHLMRFEDGPMSRRENISNLAGSPGNMAVAADLFGWPLPDRVKILCHEGVERVAFWDADKPPPEGLPSAITESPNVIIYRKIAESQLKKPVPGVLRGATYCLEAKA